MNAKILFFLTFCSAFLIASTTAMSQNSTNISISQSNNGGDSQSQEIGISLDSSNLGKPYTLRISAPQGTQITGQITRNGKVIKRLRGNQSSTNLSPSLSKGKQTFKISGGYKPAGSSIQIKVSGPGTQVSQRTSGNGKLNQTLVINVK